MNRLLILLFTSALLMGCGSSKHLSQVQYMERVKHDTLYINQMKYDSVYVYQDRYLDRSKDTLYIKDNSVEYRYRLLRDTIYQTKLDTITVTKASSLRGKSDIDNIGVCAGGEAIPSIYKWSLGICIILILLLVLFVLRKLKLLNL